jgi:lipopolysaccharide transport system permease protein
MNSVLAYLNAERLLPVLKVSKEVRRYIELLWLLTKKEVTLKYKRTLLGVLWSLLHPVLQAFVMLVAFSNLMRFEMKNYWVFLLCGLFPWNWFSASVTLSTTALISNVNLIKRIVVPRHLFVVAIVLSQLVNFLFAFPIILAIAVFYGNGVGVGWLALVPLLIVSQSIVTSGVSLIVAMLNAYFRDIEYIVGVFTGLLFWITPIVFPLETVPDGMRPLLLANPLAYLVASWRDLVLRNTFDWVHVGISLSSGLIVLGLGLTIFRQLGKRLDEVL